MKLPPLNQSEDKILDEYLAGKSHLSDAYKKLVIEQPDPATDLAILAASRREVHAGPQRAGTGAKRNWTMPLSIAAVLALSVSLTLMMTEREQKQDEFASQSKPAATSDKPLVASVPQNVVVAEAPSKAKIGSAASVAAPVAKSVPSAAAVGSVAAIPQDKKSSPQNKAESARAPIAPSPKLADRRETDAALPVATARSRAPVEVAKSSADKTVTQSAQAFPQPAGIIADTAPITADAGDVPAASARSAQVAVEAKTSAPPAATAPAPTVVITPAPVAVMAENSRAAGMAAQPQGRAVQNNESATAAAYGAAQTWLAKIEALLREAKTDEAEQTLAEFKQRFPNYVTPESIKAELARQRAALNADPNK
jgi:hypothetical protein